MMRIENLSKKAGWVRKQVLESAVRAGKGHLGGTYSCVEILVALYYANIISIDKKDLECKNRDRFILSKGHACLALYSILFDLKIISKKVFYSYGQNGGLGGQLDTKIPGVDFNTGSLGHSVGVGAGMALAGKMNSQKYKVITLIGDSEMFEGSVWEALTFAAREKLNNLIVIVDRNKLMVTEKLENDGIFENFETKIKSFGWNYFVIDGHNFIEIIGAFKKIAKSRKPSMILAHTIKGKGVSFMENELAWHTGVPKGEHLERARKELENDWG